MIVLSRERAVILHIPKCGGKALRTAFLPDDMEGDYWHWRYLPEIGRWADMAHLTMDVLRALPEWSLLQSSATIAVVRNPIERFFSCLKEHNGQHGARDLQEVVAELDEVRIAHDPRYVHFCPQHRFTHIGNKRYVDFIARLEHLHDDLRAIGVKANFGQSFFQAIDRIPVEPPISRTAEFTTSSVALEAITRFYYRDFLLFGYPAPETDWFRRQTQSKFDRLLITPDASAEWDADHSARPAYERFYLFERLKEQSNTLQQELAEIRGRLEMEEENRRRLEAARHDLLNEIKCLQQERGRGLTGMAKVVDAIRAILGFGR